MPNFRSAIRATLGQRQIRQSPGLALNAHSGNEWGKIPVLTGEWRGIFAVKKRVDCLSSHPHMLCNRNRNRNLRTSKALLKSQAHQGTSLFTSAATNQRGVSK